MNNLTALMSAFARAYHTKTAEPVVYKDDYAQKIIGINQYEEITAHLRNGISFFDDHYGGNNLVGHIVNTQIGPSVIARSKLVEQYLINEKNVKQYLVLASGYDSSVFLVQNMMKTFEVDLPDMINDKIKRLDEAGINNEGTIYVSSDFNKNWIKELLNNGYDKNEKSIFSLLGISYYLKRDIFIQTIQALSDNLASDSLLIFDYPNTNEGASEKKNQSLASGANEQMKSIYSYEDIETISNTNGLIVEKNLTYLDINNTFFFEYNRLNSSNQLVSPKGISYAVLRKK